MVTDLLDAFVFGVQYALWGACALAGMGLVVMTLYSMGAGANLLLKQWAKKGKKCLKNA